MSKIPTYKDALEEIEAIVGEIENDPTRNNDGQRVQMGEKCRDPIQPSQQEGFLKRDENKEIESPENKIPARAVFKSAPSAR